jgi:hypothetical protein
MPALAARDVQQKSGATKGAAALAKPPSYTYSTLNEVAALQEDAPKAP